MLNYDQLIVCVCQDCNSRGKKDLNHETGLREIALSNYTFYINAELLRTIQTLDQLLLIISPLFLSKWSSLSENANDALVKRRSHKLHTAKLAIHLGELVDVLFREKLISFAFPEIPVAIAEPDIKIDF